MKSSRFTFLALSCCLLLPFSAVAETPPTIEGVRIGFPLNPGGKSQSCSRNSQWTPVAVTLKAGKEAIEGGTYQLRLEGSDLEGLRYQIKVPVPDVAAEKRQTVMGYLVPGGDGSDFRISVEKVSTGQIVSTRVLPSREMNRDVIAGRQDILFLALGSDLRQLEQSLEKLDRPAGKNGNEVEPPGKRRYLFLETAAQLPDSWIGYDSIDVLLLTSNNPQFILELADNAHSERRVALLEWVRRGGTIVLSVGKNPQAVAGLLAKMPLMDVQIEKGDELAAMPVLSTQWCGREIHRPQMQKIPTAVATPGQQVDVLVREGQRPILLQASCGLGRVILFTFDLDATPFTNWDGQQAFWTRLQNEIAPYWNTMQGDKPGAQGGRQRAGEGVDPLDAGEDRYDVKSRLKRGLELFEEVPTVSFGWIALFLLVYIAIVGPLDYFVLKKFVKRLELTWVTFPLMVLLISVAAYVTAYAIKGDALRINKIDLVDIDLHSKPQVYGQSWFTLFSPRVGGYTVGIEPDSDAWTKQTDSTTSAAVVRLLETGSSIARVGSQSSVRHPYEYAEKGGGMRRVPIPVWATRSFSATWQGLIPEKAPLSTTDETAGIRQGRDGRGLVGRLTNNLSVPMMDVTLFYKDRWYLVGTLQPGEWKRIETLFAADARGQNREIREWILDPKNTPDDRKMLAPGLPLAPSGRAINANFLRERSAYKLMKPLMFFQSAELNRATNAGVRRLDQSWRLKNVPQYPIKEGIRYREEAILVARMPMLCDLADTVNTHGVSASRLWLRELPDRTKKVPSISGVMTQETYLRLFVPVEHTSKRR